MANVERDRSQGDLAQQSKGTHHSVSFDPAPPSPELSDEEDMDLRLPDDPNKIEMEVDKKKSSKSSKGSKSKKGENNTNTNTTATTTTTTNKPSKIEALKSKWNKFSTQSNVYLSKTKQSISKSVKDNANKLRTNYSKPTFKRQNSGGGSGGGGIGIGGGRNGHAPADFKSILPDLREQTRRENRAMKRAVMEKCYQDFHKKLYVPNFTSTGTSGLTNDDADEAVPEEIKDAEPTMSGHMDIAVAFDSIFRGEYGTALEEWTKALPNKNPRLVREILFETIMTCYYRMITEKADILKTHTHVDRDQKRYQTFIGFERYYAKYEQHNDNDEEASTLCHNVVNAIYHDISWLYFEYISVLKEANEVENVTKMLISKCCGVIWSVLCGETDEKSLLLYPLNFEPDASDSTKTHEIEWFERVMGNEDDINKLKSKSATEIEEPKAESETINPPLPQETEVQSNQTNASMNVCFPGVVQIHKNATPQQHNLLCKAKVFFISA